MDLQLMHPLDSAFDLVRVSKLQINRYPCNFMIVRSITNGVC